MILRYTPIFKRDFKRVRKKHYDLQFFQQVIDDLQEYDLSKLMRLYKDHALKGEWIGFRELHISNDWLLIYRVDGKKVTLVLTRTGKHDELF
ncbi:type II toxin-antitoxin system YafQ family toxin [Companilactobacillus suantsaicola]|uniref:Type II toxin-antitoxin system YafQ family toxin n=1 Tax=Companilactobacillus suantsaicola TaxID=2487723 RepID=A0A4Z0JJ99_9LACO|nr:type II toxin-antitoxin system YafQ family toxin [Companilactobacillus suantsaicola]TGD22970.1 type II toxin-antitoxin system YafQ family toxin [Companilactobacillus suantsaicola]